MTTIFEEEVICAVCGMKQTVQEMGSTSSFGAMDLDTRPPPLRRSTMSLWVHECGECGYVAPELGEAVERAARIVASADYRVELKSTERVRLANRMVCRSLLEAAAGNLVTAGWRRVYSVRPGPRPEGPPTAVQETFPRFLSRGVGLQRCERHGRGARAAARGARIVRASAGERTTGDEVGRGRR